MHEEYWDAVLNRDGRFDGKFVFGVRTTGIYCRPGCPARRPRRENVEFFTAPSAAEAAGFRACLRCHPASNGMSGAHLDLAQRVSRYIEANLDRAMTLAELGRAVGLSPHHLQRTFKRVMGISPRQYADAARLARLREQLKVEDTVSTAVYEAGYGSSSRVYERAPNQLGMTPAVFQRHGKGIEINYSVVPSPLGRLMVAATARGICFVSLGDNEHDLEAALRAEFRDADIARDDEGLGQWVSVLLEYLDGQHPHLDLPLDVRATAFQRRVWEALQAIPYGDTRTYREIAAAIGSPKAARAVGRACATNPVSLVIPCHRAVREDGHLGGYRWGLHRKESLLERERATADARVTEPEPA